MIALEPEHLAQWIIPLLLLIDILITGYPSYFVLIHGNNQNTFISRDEHRFILFSNNLGYFSFLKDMTSE